MTEQLTGDVLVVGAGPAGLASAYYLEQAGISYVAVDRADVVASTWAGIYPSLRLNTAGFVSHLPGRRMPLKCGVYPKGSELYAYLREYAATHQFNLRFGVEVHRIAPDGQGGWIAETSLGRSRHRAVIVASGRFSNPFVPPIPGLDAFESRWIHARDYHAPEPYTDQRVMVAGSGPSGTDIAVELATRAATPVLLSVRSDIVIARRFPYGLPDSAWHLLSMGLPRRWRRPFLNKVLYQGYSDAGDLGMTLAPNRTNRRGSSAPVRGRELIDAIRAGTIRPVAGVTRLHGRCVELMDGSQHEVDTLILSTGYRPAISYLDIAYEVDQDGWPKRISDDIEGGSTQVRNYPGLHLVGRFYRGLGPLRNIRVEAKTAVRELLSHLS